MTIELILALIVGFVIGILVALWWDSQTLVRRVQQANAEKQQALSALQKFQIQHQSNEQKRLHAETELQTAVADRTQLEETIARQLMEIEASREQLQTTITTNETMKENVEEAQDRLEELDGLRLLAEEKLATALAENGRLTSDVQLLEAESVMLQEKTEELIQVQERVSDLEQQVMTGKIQLAELEVEKDTTLTQLQQAELTNAEQAARIATLQQRLDEAEAVQQKLSVTEEKLETVDTHLQNLQDKMDDVKTKMSYSGKNQLQLIRGIGPAYARRLNEFGIHTFADLADCEVEQVAAIIKKKAWQDMDIQEWLDEAKALAASLR